jgi:hypothetical protein
VGGTRDKPTARVARTAAQIHGGLGLPDHGSRLGCGLGCGQLRRRRLLLLRLLLRWQDSGHRALRCR